MLTVVNVIYTHARNNGNIIENIIHGIVFGVLEKMMRLDNS